MFKIALMALAIAALTGCSHLKGVVVDEVSGRPVRTAVLTVGRPDGIAVLETHPVDSTGKFDFSISSLDVHQVYVYDGAASPEAALHLTSSQLNEKMQIKLPRAAKPETPMMVPRQ